jgi:hypothetical protein
MLSTDNEKQNKTKGLRPGDGSKGGDSTASIVCCTSVKGFSPNTSVYRVTPNDHTSSSGPWYLHAT